MTTKQNREQGSLPELARLIKYWRCKANLKRYELAERCGVVPAAVTRWEQGMQPPLYKSLVRVAQECGAVDETGAPDMERFYAAHREITDDPPEAA